jgi:hypothetical protein
MKKGLECANEQLRILREGGPPRPGKGGRMGIEAMNGPIPAYDWEHQSFFE